MSAKFEVHHIPPTSEIRDLSVSAAMEKFVVEMNVANVGFVKTLNALKFRGSFCRFSALNIPIVSVFYSTLL